MNTLIKTQPALKIIYCALLLFPGILNAATIFVNPSAVGSNNGTSWANAYTSLSNALLAAANGDEIWVKQGIYKPVTQVDVNNNGGTEAREATFQIPDGVALYGGFLGSELTRDERNSAVNITVLSGDIDNDDVNADGDFIADSASDIIGNNAYHVIFTSNVSAATIVDGFIITAGKAMSADVITDANQDGGAWYNKLSGLVNASSPTMLNLIFQANFASSEGGATYHTNAPAGGEVLSLIKNCKFIANKSNFAGGAINIGSFSAGNYQPTIKGCEFSNNEAYRRGGAIYLVGDHVIVDSCIFKDNKVTAISMNGTLPGSGGGVTMTGSNALFSYCVFTGNNTTGNPTGPFEGGGGGAVYMSVNEIQTTTLGVSAPAFISCGFYSNIASGNTAAWGGAATHLSDGGKLTPKYVNCIFSGNQAQDDGGAVANFTRVISAEDGFIPELAPNFTNCTFTANHAGKRGGAIYNDGFIYLSSEVLNARIDNSILWNNTAITEGPQVYTTGNNVVAYSLVQGSGGSGGGWNSSIGTDGGNNLDINPGFINEGDPDGADNMPATPDDGLALTLTAPPVNAGNNAAIALAGITKDYVSAPRIFAGTVDMGAYESEGTGTPDLPDYCLEDWDKTPFCHIHPWAFLFADKNFQKFIWDGPAKLIDKGATAIVTGKIINRDNKKMGFQVYLKLVKKQNWKSWSAKGRTYAAFTPEALAVAKKQHVKWAYWELSNESYLKGAGDLSGKLTLAHQPVNKKTGFQLGQGANGWDKDFGLSGAFSYEGKLTNKGKKLTLKGVGSMNADALVCKKDCEPAQDKLLARGSKEPVGITYSDPGKTDFSIFPVPARDQITVAIKSLPGEKHTFRIYDANGRFIRQQSGYANNGNIIVSLKKLSAGSYILQLISNKAQTISKKFIIE